MNNRKFKIRILWLLVTVLAFIGAYLLILNQYNRYRIGPTVISLDRDYREWIGTLPAVTLCYHDKLDQINADRFIAEKWNTTISDPDYFVYLEFITSVVNATASNYIELSKFADDERFDAIDLNEIIERTFRKYEHKLSVFDETQQLDITLTMTERGFCYVFNSPIASVIHEKNMDLKKLKPPIKCEYGKQQCFIKVDIFESTGTVEVHSPYEVLATDAGVAAIDLQKSDEVMASFQVLETFAGNNLLKLDVQQRQCRFPQEKLYDLPVYSKTLCLSKCRADLALEMCGCLPFFYNFVDGEKCNPAGFECLLNFKWPIWSYHICKCPHACNEYLFSIHSVKTTSWGENEHNKVLCSFRWDVLPPKIRMRRDVVFAFEDFLVSLGGAISLFVGSSFTSILRFSLVISQQIILLIAAVIQTSRKFCSKKPIKIARKPKRNTKRNMKI